jgi:hypothetical protein
VWGTPHECPAAVVDSNSRTALTERGNVSIKAGSIQVVSGNGIVVVVDLVKLH